MVDEEQRFGVSHKESIKALADGVDVALRLGSLPDSSATARKLAEAPRLLVRQPATRGRRTEVVLLQDGG